MEYINTFEWYVAILVFCLFVVVDVLYAYYTLAVTRIQPFKAATTAAAMYFINAIGVLNYIDNPLYLIPIAVGSFAGTYGLLKYESMRKKK